MSPSLWQRGWVSVMVILGLACGLLLSPGETTQGLRERLRDALAPGARVVALARDWTGQTTTAASDRLAGWSISLPNLDDPRRQQLERERDALRRENERLQTELAGLRRKVVTTTYGDSPYLRRESTAPLVKTMALTARVLTDSADQAEKLAERLLDAGATAGLRSGDFVVAESSTSKTSGVADVVIDQGRDLGIAADWPVVAAGGLLGRVRNCGALTSTVQPVTDPEFRLGAQLVRTTAEGAVFGAQGLYAGNGSPRGELTLIPTTEPVTVGDRVYSQETLTGEALLILIGTVTAAETPAGEPHWRITVTPAAVDPGRSVDVIKLELNPERLSAAAGRPAESRPEAWR